MTATSSGEDNSPDPVDNELVELSWFVGGLAFPERSKAAREYFSGVSERRAKRRLSRLRESAEAAGFDLEQIVDATMKDDQKAELLEDVLRTAANSRYEDKIAYLGRCLAAAMQATEPTEVDLRWLRVAAVKDIEAIHVEMLLRTQRAQAAEASEVGRRQLSPRSDDDELPSVTEKRIQRDVGGARLHLGAFQPVMAVLLRTGLVVAAERVDVEVEVDYWANEDQNGQSDPSVDANPSVWNQTVYRVSGLGLELLDELTNGRSTEI